MRLAQFRLFFLFLLFFTPTASSAADRCWQIKEQLEKERLATQNDVARERAAIAVLERPWNELQRRQSTGEITLEQYKTESNKWRKAEDCVNAENALKHDQAYYAEAEKLIAAKCQKGPVDAMYADWVRDKEARKAKACGGADLQTVANIVKRLSEIMVERAASEERESPAVKQANSKFKDEAICKQVRSVAALAPTGFKAITGPKTDQSFVPGVKISDMVGMDIYQTSTSLSFDFLSVPAKCNVEVGNEKDGLNIALRVGLTYACEWNYTLIKRKELEEKADMLFNVMRGCFSEVSEGDSKSFRHDFVADKSIRVLGKVYYGEKNPSHISLSLSRFAPEVDMACTQYEFKKNPADREICMKKFKP